MSLKMFTRFIWLTVTAATLISAVPLEHRQDTYPCTNGVFVLGVRATDSATKDPNSVDPRYNQLGPGVFQVVNAIVTKAGSGSYNRSVPYSAGSNKIYAASTTQGAIFTQNIIKNYANQCKTVGNKKPRIALVGYSQGAQVISLALMGGNLNGTTVSNLDAYKQYIVAGAIFGDPSFVANTKPVDGGNATQSGLIAQTPSNYAYFNTNYGSKLRSYCTDGDRFCASGKGPDNQKIHLAEVAAWKADAINFVVSLV